MPFYNAESTLNDAIRSIYNQSFEDFECILIDNNSTDNSREIAQSWAAKDKRFKLAMEDKQGVAHASNLGSALAVGKYIARMDADDIAFQNRLMSQCKFLETHKDVDVVAGKALFVKGEAEADGFKKYVEWSNSVLSYDSIKLKQFVEAPIINPTAMWRKFSAEKYGNYQAGDFPEDYEMWLRWLSEGAKTEKLDEFVLKWQDSSTRLTRTDEIYSVNAFYEVKTKYLAKWLSVNNPFHPNVLVWGASRLSRKRAELLRKYGVEIDGFIDISDKRQIDGNIINYTSLEPNGKYFILTYINHLNARDRVNDYLDNHGYIEGRSYLNIS